MKSLHFQRLAKNTCLQWANEKAQYIRNEKENTLVDLNYTNFKTNQGQKASKQTSFERIFNPIKGFKVSVLPQLIAKQDSAAALKNEQWIQRLQQDPYVYECFWIVNDMLG